jgi:hypothetical protein
LLFCGAEAVLNTARFSAEVMGGLAWTVASSKQLIKQKKTPINTPVCKRKCLELEVGLLVIFGEITKNHEGNDNCCFTY